MLAISAATLVSSSLWNLTFQALVLDAHAGGGTFPPDDPRVLSTKRAFIAARLQVAVLTTVIAVGIVVVAGRFTPGWKRA